MTATLSFFCRTCGYTKHPHRPDSCPGVCPSCGGEGSGENGSVCRRCKGTGLANGHTSMSATLTPIRQLPNVALDLSPELRAEFARAAAVANDLRSSSHSLGHAARCAISEGLTEEEFKARAAFAFVAEGGTPTPPPLAEPPELATQPRKRRAIWQYYREKWLRYHLTPSTREVQRHYGISSPSVVVYHLKKLTTLGLLEHLDGGVAHSYRLPAKWR